MTLKEAVSNSLLMFVAATCVVLIVKALPQSPGTPKDPTSPADAARAASAKDPPGPSLAMRDGIKVYYLHGNVRCPTCRTIEAYAREAVETGFAAELASGQIVWQAINYESPGNEHYATDYQVVAPNVVLAMFKDGKQVKWKGLPEVWEHVDDKDAFFAFVQTNLREFLGQPPGPSLTPRAPVASSPVPAPVPTPVPGEAASASVGPVALPPAEASSHATNPIRPPIEPAPPSLPLPE